MDITQLLAFSVKNKASDLHLSAELPPMIRVHGDVRRINLPAMEHKDVHSMVYGVCQSSGRLWSGGCLNLFGFGIPFGVEKYSVGKTPVAHATRPSRGIAHLGVFVERGRPSHQCLVLAPMPL